MIRRPRVLLGTVVSVGACLLAPMVTGTSSAHEWRPSTRGDADPAARSASPAKVSPVQGAAGGVGTTRVAALVADSAWSWYMDPRVLATSRATYFSSVRNTGDIQVTSVDRGTARLRHAVIQQAFEADDHNAPSLTELEDGRIVAFWNAHGVVPARYRVTVRPGDVTTFGPVLELTGSGLEDDAVTYTSILQLRGSEERYHLFTRRASDDAWVMTTSEDMLTWSPAVRLFAHDDPESYPYAKFVTTGWETIHMVVSDRTARPGERSSLHHMSLSDGVFRRSDGTGIRSLAAVSGTRGRPPRPVDPSEGTRIYDGRSADGRARPYDIALDGSDPVVVFTTGSRWDDRWTYRWMRRGDEGWSPSTLLRSGTAPAGLTLRHDDPTRVVLVRDGAVEEYRTPDEGDSWVRRLVAPGRPEGNRTPAAPWSSEEGPVTAAWLSGKYDGFRDGQWSTSLVFETSDPAPVDLRAGWPRDVARGGSVSARVTAGVDGPPVADRTVWLLVRPPGEDEEWVRSGRTAGNGTVELDIDPDLPAGTRLRLHVPTTPEWGQAVSPPRVVPRRAPARDGS